MQLHVIWYAAIIAVSCAFALVLTREARTAAKRFGLVDVPDGGRRRHLGAVPRGGGIPLFISVGVTLALVFLLAPAELRTPALATTPPFGVLVAGAVAVLLLGFVDDIRGLGARTKFFTEVVIAVALFAGGLRIHVLHVGSASIEFNTALSLVVTVLWVVGITNAFNLIDGSDGVASGAAVLAALTMALVAALGGDGLGATIALTIAGATLGFLFFNFPPASMFLGDSGSLFLGYAMSVLGIVTAQKATTMVAVAIPVVSCGFPIIDALLTIARRFLRRQPIFASDRGHIHHRLQDLGQSPRQVALLLYAVSAAFALLSLLLVRPRGLAIGVFAIAAVFVCFAIQRLRIPELLELHRVIVRGLHQREVIAYNMRVREAAELLGKASTAADVEGALVHCFGMSEFERVELNWVGEGGRGYSIRVGEGGSWPAPVLRNGKAQGVAHAVTRAATDVGAPRVWEICLPFRDGHGQILGTLTLWAQTERVHLLMDLRLVARELQPLLQAALTRTAFAEEKRVPTSERRISAEVGIAQAS